MNMAVEKKKFPSALPTNWPTRDEQSRKSQNQLTSTGKVDVYYYRYFFFYLIQRSHFLKINLKFILILTLHNMEYLKNENNNYQSQIE